MNWNSWIWNGERERERDEYSLKKKLLFWYFFVVGFIILLSRGRWNMRRRSTIYKAMWEEEPKMSPRSPFQIFDEAWKVGVGCYTAKLKNNRMTKCRLWNTRECIISIADLFWKRLVNTMEPLNTAGGGDSQIQKKTSKLMKWRSNCLIQ